LNCALNEPFTSDDPIHVIGQRPWHRPAAGVRRTTGPGGNVRFRRGALGVESKQDDMKQDLRAFRLLSATALTLGLGLVPAVSTAMIRGPGNDPSGVTARSASEVDPEPSGLDRALRSVVVIEPGPAGSGPASGSGSGFVFDSGGHVITNAHVIGAARTVRVGLMDGRSVDAVVVGTDPRTDIAVVRLPAGVEAPALDLLDPVEDVPALGAPVFALGHPMGYRFSVTSGVISGAGRSYDVITPVDFLQHDAALNPGSSGGPLVDLEGRVLGVNTATPPETLFDIGIGLAIPIALAAEVAQQLIADGSIVRGALGLRVSHADAQVAAALGAGEVEGALIDSVEPDGAAARAGLMAGDLILAIDGQPVAYPRDVLARTMPHRPNERVRLDFVRAGQRRSAVVTLGPDRPSMVSRVGLIAASPPGSDDELGLEVGLDPDGRGAVVTDVAMGSLAQTYGLSPGDRIEAVNGRAVARPDEVHAALGRARGTLVVLRVERQGQGQRHINLPRTLVDSVSRRPGLASEQQSPLL